MELINFAIFADCHSVPVGETEPATREGGRDNLIAWRAAIEAREGIDVVIALGDISDEHAGAADAASLIADMDNLYAAHGNHDISTLTGGDKSAEKSAFRALYAMPSDYYAVDIGFVRMIVLDACYTAEGAPEAITAGNLPAAELSWLASELDALQANQPALICMHHCIGAGGGYFDSASEAALGAALESRPNVYLVMGHRHPSDMLWRNSGARPGLVIPALCDEMYTILTVERRCGAYCQVSYEVLTVTP